jgi:hypothetical protein
MARAPKPYTRLTRNASGVGVATSLWLAADHLLLLRSTGYSESYSRLQLRDIKGFFLTRSGRRFWWGLWWGLIALLSGMVLIAALVKRETPVGSVIVLALAAVMLAWNHLLGAGCQLHVVTGVQTLPLPALVRIKKTRRVLNRLQPMIAAVQAGLGAVSPAPPELPPAPGSP